MPCLDLPPAFHLLHCPCPRCLERVLGRIKGRALHHLLLHAASDGHPCCAAVHHLTTAPCFLAAWRRPRASCASPKPLASHRCCSLHTRPHLVLCLPAPPLQPAHAAKTHTGRTRLTHRKSWGSPQEPPPPDPLPPVALIPCGTRPHLGQRAYGFRGLVWRLQFLGRTGERAGRKTLRSGYLMGLGPAWANYIQQKLQYKS
ncbi:hypothetical protein BRADI_1g03555v3 [Brachypodium distachyon]|uniref:Uncharacterized protein n=1 Tax=Brachypodium distachyon TaxID=15368 RepID=A0A0Q3GPR5_BRADI|nr:hypothetical protein BRADI_1g03555v3 [Brachypodium distachyon]